MEVSTEQSNSTVTRVGRRTDYSEERAKKITDAIRIGATHRAACNANGISQSTFYLWLKQFPQFSEDVNQAEGQAELNHTTTIAQAAAGKIVVKEKITEKNGVRTIEREYIPADWRASIEWLKRRRRPDYGDQVDIRRLDDDTLLRLILKAQEIGVEIEESADLPALEPFVDTTFSDNLGTDANLQQTDNMQPDKDGELPENG